MYIEDGHIVSQSYEPFRRPLRGLSHTDISRPPLVMCCRGDGHPLTFVRNAQESYPAITTEMLRRNNVGPIHAGDPNTFRRDFIES